MSKYETHKPVVTQTEHAETSSGKKLGAILVAGVLVAGLGAAALYLVDVDQTQEARLPSVDVQVTEGQMPKFDAEVADVRLGETEVNVEVPTVGVETKTIEIEVPVDVDAGTETTTIDLPTLEIDRPDEDDPAGNPAN